MFCDGHLELYLTMSNRSENELINNGGISLSYLKQIQVQDLMISSISQAPNI